MNNMVKVEPEERDRSPLRRSRAESPTSTAKANTHVDSKDDAKDHMLKTDDEAKMGDAGPTDNNNVIEIASFKFHIFVTSYAQVNTSEKFPLSNSD